jgi:murein DD-endopeptidase MepM/ murein hydrolase activator NlpD
VTLRRLTAVLVLAAFAAAAIPTQASAAYRYGARVMKMGSKGKDVRKLQRNLTTLGFPTPADGVYGRRTKKSVKRLERKRGWRRDGKVSKKDAVRIRKLVAKRKAKPSKLFFLNGLTKPSVNVTAGRAGSAAVEVKNASTGETVATLPVTFASPGTQTVSWNGITSSGAGAPEGSYRLSVDDPGTAQAAGVQAKAFSYYWHAFPLPGEHSYGGKGSRFGAKRPGHIHQGQDLGARCGEKLYAAAGGVVTAKAYQAGGAGYYVVIKGAATGRSYVYFHMIKPSWAVKGQTVYAGQQIGKVGNTGSSSGCHLHFELWTPPGWYEGGNAYDPLAELKLWDAYS